MASELGIKVGDLLLINLFENGTSIKFALLIATLTCLSEALTFALVDCRVPSSLAPVEIKYAVKINPLSGLSRLSVSEPLDNTSLAWRYMLFLIFAAQIFFKVQAFDVRVYTVKMHGLVLLVNTLAWIAGWIFYWG